MTRQEILERAQAIAEDYRDRGYSLTLRQAYYQCVSQSLIENSQESYKRLGDIIGDARLAGDFDLDLIVDRSRHVGDSAQNEAKLNVDLALGETEEYVKSIPYWTLLADRWFGQPKYVSAWVEKDAMTNVFEGPCGDLKVGFFACKGYPSHSSLWDWIKKYAAAVEENRALVEDDKAEIMEPAGIEEAVILYFGDHDPDGWQIPRSALELVHKLIDISGLNLPPVRLERIALNMDQIQQFNPPPFPAKMSSSRYASYVREHGIEDAWELDALRPEVLDDLIRQEVDVLFDESIYKQWQDWVRRNRSRLIATMKTPEWLDKVLKVM